MKQFIYVKLDHNPLWLCTADDHDDECQGQVLGIRLFEDDGRITANGHGVCQAFAHRTAMVDTLRRVGYVWSHVRQAEADGTTTSEQNYLHSAIYPPIDPEPVTERTTMNLDQSDLQRRLYEYLHGGGSYREQALRELEEAGAFRDSQSDQVTRQIIDDYWESSHLRGLFCDDGRQRFYDAFLSTEANEPTIEESTVTITETTPFFNDQRVTLTAEDIKNHSGIDAGQRFVPVEAMLDAIKEYQAKFDLCDAGVGEFLDEFGLSLVRTFETEITLGSDGPVIARFQWKGTNEGDVENLSLGSLDRTLNRALDSELEDALTDVEIINGIDCYLGETRALED